MLQTAWRAISDNDLWIAATAARHARPLVTRNVRDFDNLPGVVVLGIKRGSSKRVRERPVKRVAHINIRKNSMVF